ncbi:Hypothetical protein BRZCDTV_113, partial [Brazilian cedratvirus IHUMI]
VDDESGKKESLTWINIAVPKEGGDVWVFVQGEEEMQKALYDGDDGKLHAAVPCHELTKEESQSLPSLKVVECEVHLQDSVYSLSEEEFVERYSGPEKMDLLPSDRYKLYLLANTIVNSGAYYIDDSKKRKVRVELLGVNVVVPNEEGREVTAFPGGYRGEQEKGFFYIQDGELHSREMSEDVIEAKDNYTLLNQGVLEREGETIYSFSVGEFIARFGEEYIEWKQYADSAEEELGIPESYFNLALDRDITPLQRYLEVAAQVVLTPDAAVTYDRETGQVFGIYESLAGVYESLRRNDAEMVLFFANRLRPQSRSLLQEQLLSGEIRKVLVPNFIYFRTVALRALYSHLGLQPIRDLYPTPWQLYVEDLAQEGEIAGFDVDAFPSDDAIIQSLSYLISREKYWALNSAIELNLPPEDVALAALASGSQDMIKAANNYARNTVLDALVREGDMLPGKRRIPLYYFSALAQGCNSKLWTRLRDISREEPPEQSLLLLRAGYYLKVATSERPVTVDYYNILRVERPLSDPTLALNVDTAILLAEEGVSVKDIVKNNLGNVNLLLTLSPELSDRDKAELKSESLAYPLTFLLL